MKQNNLFSMMKKAESVKAPAPSSPKPPKMSLEDAMAGTAPRTGTWLPQKGELVHIPSINDGYYKDAVVEYVDFQNLYQDHMWPIQVFFPSLGSNGTMMRFKLRDVFQKEVVK